MAKKEIIPLPDWSRQACKNVDPDIFFLDSEEKANFPNDLAASYCNRCEIVVQCLDWAIRTKQPGIWGNTTQRQREKLARPTARVFCPGCDSEEILDMDGSETCISCGLSWQV